MGIEKELKLQAGDTLQLEVVGDQLSQRYMVKLIGYLPGRSILVTTPQVGGRVIMMREGLVVNVRLLAKNSVIGFTTSVLRAQMQPYPYLHLSYPSGLEAVVIRRSQRVKVHVDVSVQSGTALLGSQESLSAAILDISFSGALLEADRPLGVAGDRIVVDLQVTVAHREYALSLPSVIRSVQAVGKTAGSQVVGYQHGLEFSITDPHDSLVLHGFVYEQIVSDITGCD